jgi:hypothetical protein
MDKEQEFNKGYNQGYILRKYDQKQFENLYNGINTESKYTDGFNSGGKEAVLEISRTRLDELDDLRSKGDDFGIER